ncbi:4-hydroxythreonine-4-phosphate dehydrogenase PdxA [Pontixanthobacter sp.]|uniref:4-hydroxythreonine-4-phosphate dehydrogenase PdxA n=1 Tax=Pontixanthobacter sp. TaxID=2792078 RepID=UPI003C7C1982
MTTLRRVFAVSLGDPAGIGPEIIARAWTQRVQADLPPFCVIGGAGVLAAAATACGLDVPVRAVASLAEAADIFETHLPVFGTMDEPFTAGHPSQHGAKLALASLEGATQLALGGEVPAMITAPVSKTQLADIGFEHAGQTEYLAHSCAVPPGDAVMMLAGPQLRAIPLTVHCALADVAGMITTDRIVHRATIADAALRRDFGIKHPHIAIAGLNPHAGENGAFGKEEIDHIAPAIAALQSAGICASGPHPADALFAPHARPGYDAALCMYHDQALIPVKALDFDKGVNVTLGLPIIRTSPDHGTAFDIAGQGVANAGAMIAAIQMAGACAARRNG